MTRHVRPLLPVLFLVSACSTQSAPPAAPEGLRYPEEYETFLPSIQAPTLVPVLEQGLADVFTITPPLPAGLELDPQTGQIHGTPLAPAPRTIYVVTAQNSQGDTQTTISLGVDDGFEDALYAYVGNYSDHTISMFVIDDETGQLRHNGYVSSSGGPASVSVYPTGHFAYVTNLESGRVSCYRVNRRSGHLELVSQAASGLGTVDFAIHPSGRFAYSANSAGSSLSSIDPTQAAESVGSSIRAYRVNPITGELSDLGAVGAGGPVSVAVSPNGKALYVANFHSSTLGVFQIEDDGTLEGYQQVPAATSPVDIVVAPSGDYVYVASHFGNAIATFAVDPVDGSLSNIQELPTNDGPVGLAIDPQGERVFLTQLDGLKLSSYSTQPDGTLALDAEIGAGPTPLFCAVDPTGTRLYLTHLESQEVSQYAVDPDSGAVGLLDRQRVRHHATGIALLNAETGVVLRTNLAFSANSGFDDVSTFVVDPQAGSLTDRGEPIATGAIPSGLGLDLYGGYLYTANAGTGDVSQFSVDPNGGQLAEIGGPVFAGSGARSIAVEPRGLFAFAAVDQGVQSYEIDPTSGALDPLDLRTMSGTPVELVAHPAGRFLYTLDASGAVHGATIHPLTGTLDDAYGTPYSTSPGSIPTLLLMHPSGRFLYVADEGNKSIDQFSVNSINGHLVLVATAQLGTTVSALAAHPSGDFLLCAHADTGEVRSLAVDIYTGELTQGDVEVGGLVPTAVACDASGRFAWVSDQATDSILTYALSWTPEDRSTLELVHVASTPLGPGAAPSDFVSNTVVRPAP